MSRTVEDRSLVDLVLEAGNLVRENSVNKQIQNEIENEDFLLNSFETAIALLDNSYYLLKFQMFSSSLLLKNLAKNMNYLWIVSILINCKRLVGRLIKLHGLRTKLQRLIGLIEASHSGYSKTINSEVAVRFRAKLELVAEEFNETIWELASYLVDFVLILIEMGRLRVHSSIEKAVNWLSTVLNLVRVLSKHRGG